MIERRPESEAVFFHEIRLHICRERSISDRIGVRKCLFHVFSIGYMIRKITLILHEIDIFVLACIKGGIHVIVFAVQLYDIPGMSCSVHRADYDTTVYPCHQHEAVDRCRITLTDSLPFAQSRIGRMLDLGAVVIQTFMIVGYILTDIGVDTEDLIIVAHIIRDNKIDYGPGFFGYQTFLLLIGKISRSTGYGNVCGPFFILIR